MFSVWISDLSFPFLDLRFDDLNLRFVKIDVGCCP